MTTKTCDDMITWYDGNIAVKKTAIRLAEERLGNVPADLTSLTHIHYRVTSAQFKNNSRGKVGVTDKDMEKMVAKIVFASCYPDIS